MKDKIKSWVDANVWDGEDRSGCKGDRAVFDPDGLQELCDDLVEAMNPVKVKPLVWSKSMGVPCLCVAVTEFGLIRIEQHLLKHGHCFNVCSDIECNSYAHKSEEAAKQAAQEQYEKLILGALEL